MGFVASLVPLSLYIMHRVLRVLLYSPSEACNGGSFESVGRYLSLHVPASFMAPAKTVFFFFFATDGPRNMTKGHVNRLGNLEAGSLVREGKDKPVECQ